MNIVLKQTIINFLIFCLAFLAPMQAFGETAPQQDEFPEPMRLTINSQVAKNLTFPELQGLIADNASKFSGFVQDSSKEKLQQINQSKAASAITQTVILSIVGLAAQEAHRRIIEQHLEMTTANVQNVSKTVVNDFSTTESLMTWMVGAYGTYEVARLNAMAWETLLHIPFIASWFTEFIGATVMSLMNNGFSQVLTVSANFALNYPDKVGGLSQDERAAISNLIQRLGISYLFYGMINGKPAIKSAYNKIFWKVGYNTILHSQELRAAIFHNIWREVVLSGNALTIMMMNVLGSEMSKKVIGNKTIEELGLLRYTTKTTLISLITFASQTLIFDTIKDGETYAIRGAYTSFLTFDQDNHDRQLIYLLPGMGDTTVMTNLVKKNLSDRADGRETRLVYDFSMTKIALDEIFYFTMEMRYIEKKYDSGDKELTQDLSLLQDVMKELEVTWDLIGIKNMFSLRYDYAQTAVAYYKKMFERSTNNVLGVYSHEHDLLGTLEKAVTTVPSVKLLVAAEDDKVLTMSKYLRGLVDDLRPGLDANPRTVNHVLQNPSYASAQDVLNKALFWGVAEDRILLAIPK